MEVGGGKWGLKIIIIKKQKKKKGGNKGKNKCEQHIGDF